MIGRPRMVPPPLRRDVLRGGGTAFALVFPFPVRAGMYRSRITADSSVSPRSPRCRLN